MKPIKMTPANLEKWKKIRAMGRSRYIRLYWVLGWGLSTAAFWAVFMAWSKGWNQLPMFLVFGAIGFPLGGFFLGRWMWTVNERAAGVEANGV